ncbi:MAG: DDE-type integrase/transposase/recombinase [Desulfobulbaceae bacterium]|nr:DDE-type integrase/transposase/recombinase [Desulfobulbaceae bacterium]
MDSSLPNSAEGTDRSFNPEIVPDSPCVVPNAPFGQTNGLFASAGISVSSVDSAAGSFTTEQLPNRRASDSFSRIRPLLPRSLIDLSFPAVPEIADTDILPIRSEFPLNPTGTLMNGTGRTSVDHTPGPGSRTPGQPGSRFRIHQKNIPSTPVESKMAGTLFLPAEPTSASINSIRNDARLFFDVQFRSMDLPQRKTSCVKFLIDSRAEISAISYQDFLQSVKSLSRLYPTKIRLHNFDNSRLRKPKGQVNLKISVGREWVNANFQIVSNSCQSVLGAPELRNLKLLLDMGAGTIIGSADSQMESFDFREQNSDKTGEICPKILKPLVEKHVIQTCELDGRVSATLLNSDRDPELDKLTWKFPKLFTEGVGIYSGEEHSIRLKPDAVPTRSRMREAPQAYAQLAADEIESMLKDGLCEQIKSSNWVSPIHYVKKDGKCVRVTVDFSTGLNKAIIPVSHPLPRPSDIYQRTKHASHLSKLDLSKGYWHINLSKESRPLTAFITPSHGLLQFTHLPMGMIDSGAVFCRAVEQTLRGLNGVDSYIDDILIYGKSKEEHDSNLLAICSALEKAGFRLNKKKILICKTTLPMLGSILHAKGRAGLEISIDPKKTEAISKFPVPTSVTGIKSFLGACQRTHVSSFAHVAEPLTHLTRKGIPFEWTQDCQSAFKVLKAKIVNAIELTLFDPTFPILLRTDASDYGLGAELLLIKDGKECPVTFAARTLSSAERNYSTPEKEALAAVWAIDKQFSKYLLGHHFIIESDQSSLTVLLSRFSACASQWIQRWTEKLWKYDFESRHISGTENKVADFLSRIHYDEPLSTNEGNYALDDDDSKVIFCSISGIPISDFVESTATDQILQDVIKFQTKNWPAKASLSPELRPFYKSCLSLSVEGGLLLKGSCLCVPSELRKRTLELLHLGHPGITRMLQQYRLNYFWPGGNSSVKEFCELCGPCRSSDAVKPQEAVPTGAIPPPDGPWTELSLDITGPFANIPFSKRLIVILQDYFSKYPVILLTEKITSKIIIRWMKMVLSLFGNPLKIRSDNGPQFISTEFAEFLESRNIAHDRSPVYHPQSNGLVEVFNRYLKRGIQKYSFYSTDFTEKVDELLVHFRCTAPENSVSPAELLFGWRLRPTWAAYNHFLLPRGRADVDQTGKMDLHQLKLAERRRICKEKFARRKYGTSESTKSLKPYVVGNWVTVKLPSSPKGCCPRSKPLRVEKVLGNWRYFLSDGMVYNARRMARFFPMEHGDDFLQEWYSWDSQDQPEVPPLDHQPIAVPPAHAPEDFGFEPQPQAIAAAPAVVRRST